jgi:hypothetical protein
MAGLAFLFNAKALFVLAACLAWQYRSAGWLLAGFAIPNAAALGWLAAPGALRDWYEQVWWLGALYARSTFVANPLREGALRTVNWIGFHAALVAGAAWFFARERKTGRLPFALWGALALASIAGGWRFFPRYYLALLPLAALAAARGLTLLGKRRAAVVLLLLLVPLARFGPRYALLARDLVQGRESHWRDIAMDQASRTAAQFITTRARPGETLFVWGYRPDLFAYTRLPAATRFLESQPLSGVFADRHLFASAAIAPAWAARHRAELARSRPSFVVDGLAAFNPALAITAYPDLRSWLRQYEESGRAGSAIIYTLATATGRAPDTSIGTEREKKGR